MNRHYITILLLSIITSSIRAQNSQLVYYNVRLQPGFATNALETDSETLAPFKPYIEKLKPLLDDVMQGRLKVYASPDAVEPLSQQAINRLLFKTDTVLVFNYETRKEEVEVLTSETTHTSISILRFCEQWTWDSNHQLHKKEIAFAPVAESDGFVVMKTLFWIKQK